jgi:cytochrome c2
MEIGRPLCRPIFFTLWLTILSGLASGQPDPLASGVVVTGPPADSSLARLVEPGRNPPVDANPPVGRGLLRFYGCVTCHDLAIPPFRGRWGPDLDSIGSKTTAEWLDWFLEGPKAVHAGTRMPTVPMSDASRAGIVDMLTSLTVDVPELLPTEDIDGRKLYDRGDCRTCHLLAGVGGNRGPALDGIASKIQKPWLVAYLLDPNEMVSNSRMPLFGWEEEEANALATYLVGDGIVSVKSSLRSESAGRLAAGKAAELGCFQCHKIRKLALTLSVPDSDTALRFASYHSDGGTGLPIELSPEQRKAMASALTRKEVTLVGDGTFLEAFWKTPIPLQGTAPTAHDSLAADLSPSDCSRCHVTQFEEWKSSLHAAAMGPGVIGQLEDYTYSNPGYVEGCQTCHAPNAEQHGLLSDEAGDGYGVNYQFDERLRSEGVTCLACHVRGHTRFGPPITERPPATVWAGPGHGGAYATTAHENSAFCSSCHQFDEGDRELNGKLIQNTYREWENSPQAREGQTCQTCHMPLRSHTWKGVSDVETVRSAMEFDITTESVTAEAARIRVAIRNVGAGHHLPTYVTPKIIVSVALVTASGETIKATISRRAIGREIDLKSEVGREVYDTRIPAGGQWVWTYGSTRGTLATGARVTIEVFPDDFYAAFFDDYDTSSLSDKAAGAIATARKTTAGSRYLVHEERVTF